MREVTNIVELNKLYEIPCTDYLAEFIDGKIDAHQVFKKLGQQYSWLHKNSNYDLIGWEIANSCFNWKIGSRSVAMYCPQYFDPRLFNWKDCSWSVAQYCPEHFDPTLFNWEKDSQYVAIYCPQYLDPTLFNWEEDSWAVAIYCSQYLDPTLFNWEEDGRHVAEFCPEKLILKP